MEGFTHKDGRLFCEQMPVEQLARRYGTPLYVYSQKAFLSHLAEVQQAFASADPLICYSVKANSNLSILKTLAKSGAGFDIVSGGELFRVRKAGVKPAKVVYAGVGKTPAELAQAIKAGIFMFNAESEAEVRTANRVAGELGLSARIAPAAESRCGRPHPRQDHHGPQREQVRHRLAHRAPDFRGARTVSERGPVRNSCPPGLAHVYADAVPPGAQEGQDLPEGSAGHGSQRDDAQRGRRVRLDVRRPEDAAPRPTTPRSFCRTSSR